MNEPSGCVFSIARENPPVAGCTVSKAVWASHANSLSYFSLAAHTDISAELYDYHRIQLVICGEAIVTGAIDGRLASGDAIVTPTNEPVGIRTKEGAIYIELSLGKDTFMNPIINAGEPFALKELLPYQDGRIVNMDIAHNDAMKFVLMSFDAGTGLSEHAAPGEALVFALDGEATVSYEGKDHRLHAGETFKFDTGGRHAIYAENRFKMALLLTLA